MSNPDTMSQSLPEGAELPLSFDAWAELSARLTNLSPDERFDILAERRVKLDVWQRCERHYLQLIAKEIGQGRKHLVEKYASASSVEMERRKKAAAPPASDPAEAAVSVTEAAPIAEPVADKQPAPEAVPTFLQSRDLGVPVFAPGLSQPLQLPAENLAATAAAFELPTALRPKAADALPFREGATPSIAVSPGEPKPPRARLPVVGAATIDPSSEPSSTLPFAKAAGGPARVAYPRMPLKTHASFCAELALFPERTAEILQKYKLSGDAARAALEQEWRARLDAFPDTKAEWDKAFATYSDWLRQR